jgi:hypothetical protein
VNAFGTYVHTIIEQAGHHASKDGSATIEAQHLLLAVAAQEGTTAHQVLTSVGLDQQAVREALEREFQHSLRAAGVSLAAFDLPEPSSDPEPSARIVPSMAASPPPVCDRAARCSPTPDRLDARRVCEAHRRRTSMLYQLCHRPAG